MERQLAPQLLAIAGVAGVEAASGQVREMEVIVDQHRLHFYGLTMQEMIDTLRDENVDIAAGWVTSASFDVMAVTDGLFRSVEEVAGVLLTLPGDGDARITLSEVDEATDAIADLRRSGLIPEDIEAEVIGDNAYFHPWRGLQRGGRGDPRRAAGDGLRAVLPRQPAAQRGDRAVDPHRPSGDLRDDGDGSLGGLALGVGLLLDNAIVMLENIHRHRHELGKDPETATHDAAGEVSGAIVAGTLTNLAAVTPFMPITGLAALIFGELMLTISFAILATLAAVLTLTPMLAVLVGQLRLASGLDRSAPERGVGRAVGWMRRRCRRALPRLLRWRFVVVALAVAGLVGAVQLGGTLGNVFLPQVDDGQVRVQVALPPGTPPNATDAPAREV